MPTADDIVTINVTTTKAGFPEPTFGAVVVIGFSGTGTANNPKRFLSRDEVSTEHGATSDLLAAVEAVLAPGAGIIYGVIPTVTAVVDETTAGPIQTGTLAGTGTIDPTAPISVTVAGTPKTVEYTDENPITSTPASGKALLNTKTKAWKLDASGSTIKWTYKHVDLDAMFTSLENTDYEILVVAATKADLKWLGLLDALKSKADTLTKMLPVAFAKAATKADIQKVSVAIPSKHVIGVAHKSDDDVACAVAGVMAVLEPWVTLMWKEVPGIAQTSHYTKTDTGKRGTANTLEGGNGTNQGPVNVIQAVAGTLVLSNGLTTDGSGGTYAGWADATRTRNYTVAKVKAGLQRLRLGTKKIPFDEGGFALIRGAIEDELETLKRRGALSDYTVFIPPASSVLAADKTARKVTGIKLKGTLAGDAQDFEVALNLII